MVLLDCVTSYKKVALTQNEKIHTKVMWYHGRVVLCVCNSLGNSIDEMALIYCAGTTQF